MRIFHDLRANMVKLTQLSQRSILYFFISIVVLWSAADQVCADDKVIASCTDSETAFDYRLCVEKNISTEPFVMIPYKPNYFIGSYVADIEETHSEYDDFEAKFQLSFKIPVSDYQKPSRCFWIDGTECVAFFGYTQLSVWQMVNFDQSAPFRDTNFEPELIIAQLFNKNLVAGWKLRLINYGVFNHQSNGNVPPNSRSWNRSYLDFVFEKNNSYITFKAWKRWPEDAKKTPTEFHGDDNENIEDYAGNFELKLLHVGKSVNYSLELRDSNEHSNKMNIQFNWSMPVKEIALFSTARDLRFYIQYFKGYGETLIDYNVERERLGFGVMLTDWL